MHSTSVNTVMSPPALQLLWAIAYDDDDIAEYLADLGALLLAQRFHHYLRDNADTNRKAKIAVLYGVLHADLIKGAGRVEERVRAYTHPLDETEVPF